MGKTVLLTQFSDYAENNGWKTLSVTSVTDDVTDNLTHQLQPTKRLSNIDVSAGINTIAKATISSSISRTEPGFIDLLQQQFSQYTGVLILIDEIHEFRKNQLERFAATLQSIAPTNPPLFVACAGLPSMRSPENRITYFERSNWINIGVLDTISAIAVLRETSKKAGKPIDLEACEQLATWCGNYPFALQTLGECIWEAAHDSGTISEEHINAGIEHASRKLFEGIFSYRWPYYSGEKQHYLYAAAQLMQQLGTRHITNAQIAGSLGLATSQLSKIRLNLIYDGILIEENNKVMRFLFPIIQDWIIKEMT